jgi:hypothetical protein
MANQKSITTHERGRIPSDLVRSIGGDHSFTDCIFTSGQAAKHELGQIMKEVAGEMVPITAAADTVAGVLTYDLDATGASDVEGYILDTDAEVVNLELIYFDAADAAAKATVNAKLKALGIKVRISN